MAFYFRNSGAMADASVMSMIIVILLSHRWYCLLDVDR